MWPRPPACYWNFRTKSVHLLSYFIEKFSLWHCCNLLFLLECVNHFSRWNILLWKNTQKEHEHLLRTICILRVGCVECSRSLLLVECSVECSIECSMFLVECSAGHHLPLVRTKGVPTLAAAAAAGALESKENKNFYFYLFSGGQM